MVDQINKGLSGLLEPQPRLRGILKEEPKQLSKLNYGVRTNFHHIYKGDSILEKTKA